MMERMTEQNDRCHREQGDQTERARRAMMERTS
jgi:hypothetical protein